MNFEIISVVIDASNRRV